MNALPDIRHGPSQKVAAQYHGPNPKNAAKKVEEQIARIWHVRRARYRRTKRAYDRHESGENHGPSAILFVKFARPL
jgi:hypothetical protein